MSFLEWVNQFKIGKNIDVTGGNYIDNKQKNITNNNTENIIINNIYQNLPSEKITEIIKEMEKKIDIILKDNENLNILNVDDISHWKDINSIMEESISEPIQLACELNKVIKKIIITKDHKERREYIEAVKLIANSSKRQKGFLIWTYIIVLLDNKNNLEKLKDLKLDKIEKKYPFSNFLSFGEMSIFNKIGFIPNDIILDLKFNLKNINKTYNKKVLDNYGVRTIEELYEKVPQLKYFPDNYNEKNGFNVKGVTIYGAAIHIQNNGVIEKVAILLLNQLDIIVNKIK